MDSTYFDGRSFEDMGITVERIHDDLPAMREEMEAKPGRHGSYVNSLTLDPREITLECRYFGERWADFDEMRDSVAAWLVTRDDRRLQLRNHPGQYYLAHYKSFTEGERIGGTGIGGFEVAFTASDPIRFGEERAFVLNGSSQQTIEIGGTERADMVVTVRNARRNESAKTWGMTMNDSVIRVPLVDGNARTIVLDFTNHVVTSNGNANLLTLDSDWPDLEPGKWRCRIHQGSGTATFSWVQRYR